MVLKLDSVTKGRIAEQRMIAVLLENGLRVFQAVADIKGIDCGIVGANNHFYPIQIKSRSNFSDGDLVDVRRFHPDMFIIVYEITTRNFWVIPADEFKKMANLQDDIHRLTTTKKNQTTLAKYEGDKGITALKLTVHPSSPVGTP